MKPRPRAARHNPAQGRLALRTCAPVGGNGRFATRPRLARSAAAV